MDGETIGRLRTDRGWSQHELSRRSGVSVTNVGDIERGKVKRPHPRTIAALAAAFGLSPEGQPLDKNQRVNESGQREAVDSGANAGSNMGERMVWLPFLRSSTETDIAALKRGEINYTDPGSTVETRPLLEKDALQLGKTGFALEVQNPRLSDVWGEMESGYTAWCRGGAEPVDDALVVIKHPYRGFQIRVLHYREGEPGGPWFLTDTGRDGERFVAVQLEDLVGAVVFTTAPPKEPYRKLPGPATTSATRPDLLGPHFLGQGDDGPLRRAG